MRTLLRILVVSGALLVVAHVVPGITIDSPYVAVVAAVVLGLINLIVRPVLAVLTLPITILTLGLFLFVQNALLFWLVAHFVPGFSVASFFDALIGSLIISLVSVLASGRSR